MKIYLYIGVKNFPITVQNFPIVDKNVIFMHGIAALQELIDRYDNLHHRVLSLRSDHDEGSHIALFKEIERRLGVEAEEQLKEKALLKESELTEAKALLELERTKSGVNVEMIQQELEDERTLLSVQERAFKDRVHREEEVERLRTEAVLKMERELALSREELRRDTAKKLALRRTELETKLEERKQELELDKVRAEVEARASQERQNMDVKLKKMKVQAELDSKNMVKGIETIFSAGTKMVAEALAHPMRLAWVVGLIIIAVAAYFSVKELSRTLRELIMAALGRPKLVRETSVSWSLLHLIPLPGGIRRMIGSLLRGRRKTLEASLKDIDHSFDGIVLADADRERVVQMALTTRNAKNNNSSYRHLLLHGPPGTGKTLVARRLAETSGMDYAILSGGDVGPLGEDAVPQLHALFRWAERSHRGLLIFVDEAEAFLSSRTHETSTDLASQGQRHALNALLYQTGTETTTFMLVLATNRPEDLDEAVVDRVDVSIRVGLPEQSQRIDLCRLYMYKNVVLELDKCSLFVKAWRAIWWWMMGTDIRPSKKLDPSVLSEQCYSMISKRTRGFSGREISKLMVAMRYAAALVLDGIGGIKDNNINIDTNEKLDKGNALSFNMDRLTAVLEAKIAEHNERILYESSSK